MTRCPMCRPPIAPPTFTCNQQQYNTTGVTVYIQVLDRRLFCFRRCKDMSWWNNVDHNEMTHRYTIREPTDFVLEAWIRSNAWGYQEALRQLITMVIATSILDTDTAFFPWLETLPMYDDPDLLVAYNIGDKWVPAPILPTPHRQPYGTRGTRPFPQANPWVPHPTEGGDVQPNPGLPRN